jgi:hypothetical protein
VALVTASGRRVSINGTTDANGIVKLQYKISSNRDGVGTYTATVTSSKSGFDPGSGDTTFSVTR